jgi:RNA recognition motif-containing protein
MLQIVNVKLMFDRNSGKQRAFCFVEFDCAANRDEAMKLSGRQLKGHTIKLNRAGKQSGPQCRKRLFAHITATNPRYFTLIVFR